MKIKTIVTNTDNVEQFDTQVNNLLAEGWHLTKREVLPGMNYNANNWARRALYAELVQLDPEPEAPAEPEPVDPVELVRQLRDFCDGMACPNCPLNDWCPSHLPRNEGPADWEIPGEEAGL
jgi:hypothetical protein